MSIPEVPHRGNIRGNIRDEHRDKHRDEHQVGQHRRGRLQPGQLAGGQGQFDFGGLDMTHDMKSDKVVSIGPARARVLFPALGRVEAYWEGLRNGRSMPARAEVDPRGIADALEYAFVLERVAPGLARIRLAGMHLGDLMAMEVRGMPITAMFLPQARRELQRVTEEVMTTPAVVRLTLGSDKGFTRPALDGQMMLLPLRDAFGHVTRILGVLETRGKIGRGPRRFMIRDVETKVLEANPRPDLGAFDRLPEPRPALTPVTADTERTDGFAPRTQDLAARIADRQATARRDNGPDAGERIAHLRLVYDCDRF